LENKNNKGCVKVINLSFGITRNNLDLISEIVKEASNYGIWSVFYGEEEIEGVKSIKEKVNALKQEAAASDKPSFEIQLSFKEGQVLKKIIIFYLTNNFKNLRRSEFEIITDFILFVDDSLEFELQ
jgi:hypothetical protein